MKKYLLLTILITGFVFGIHHKTNAQTIKLLGGNTLNGALNGVLLGGATMAIQNSDDFKPVRIALGAGTLYGIGVGVHDISQVGKGQQFYISGTFNDGENSSIIVLLDTIYGAAAGAIVASSISLIIQEPITDALQYGSGVGAWAGFGFGLVDAFALAQGPDDFSQANLSPGNPAPVTGLLTYSNSSKSVNVGLLSPKVMAYKNIKSRSIELNHTTAVDLLQLRIGF